MIFKTCLILSQKFKIIVFISVGKETALELGTILMNLSFVNY